MSIPKWTGHLVGKMHNNSITNIDLASELGYDKNYISMVLNGKKTPKGARERFEAAVGELNFRADIIRESIRKNNLSQNRLAQKLKITPKTFSSKMNGHVEWTLAELQNLKKYLPELDAKEVFYL